MTGVKNQLTREREQFIEMVVGPMDSEERVAFAASIRKQFMDGTLAAPIATTIMHWWLGKPRDTIRIEETPLNYGELSDAQLAERAQLIAVALGAHKQAAETIDVKALPSKDDDTEAA